MFIDKFRLISDSLSDVEIMSKTVFLSLFIFAIYHYSTSNQMVNSDMAVKNQKTHRGLKPNAVNVARAAAVAATPKPSSVKKRKTNVVSNQGSSNIRA